MKKSEKSRYKRFMKGRYEEYAKEREKWKARFKRYTPERKMEVKKRNKLYTA